MTEGTLEGGVIGKSSASDKDKRVVGGGLRFFIGEQGNKQVVA